MSDSDRDRNLNDEHELCRRGSMMNRSAGWSNASQRAVDGNGKGNGNDAVDGDACDDVHVTTGYVSMQDEDAE